MVKLSNFMRKFKPYFFEELYRKAKAEREKGKDVINLAVGDPDIPTHYVVLERAIDEIKKPENHRYPNTKGNDYLRHTITNWHIKRHGVRFHPYDEVSILIGSKEGIAHLPLVLMNEGDICLICDPTYPTYKTGVWMVKGRIYYVALLEKNSFLPDLGSIPKSVVSKARLFFLNYPNNPTTASMDFSYMKELVRWAKRNEIFLALDCAYSEIYFNKPTHSIFEIDGAKDIAVEFYSVSKTYSMAGWRIGWICGNSKVVAALNTVKENIDSGQFNAIQNACAYAIENHEIIVPAIRERFRKRALMFEEKLLSSGWRVFKPHGTCFIWTKPPIDVNSLEACDFILKKTGVLLAPGDGFGKLGKGWLRISTTENDTKISIACERLAAIKWK
ncbi:MAG: aminotransferase class I/II-fold pyridoxal phosphate-dependent enzyme [Elusimicrobiales bacterium]